MSMHYDIEEAQGLMISESMLKGAGKNLLKEFCPNISENEKLDYYESDFIDLGWVPFIKERHQGLCTLLLASNHSEFSKENFIVIPCKDSLYFWKTKYSSLLDIVEEYKEQFSQFLPEDFDYLGNLVIAQGCYFG